MKQSTKRLIDGFFERTALSTALRAPVIKAIESSCFSLTRGGKILACGNGGSAADCEHIVGELRKGFLLRRPLSAAQKTAFSGLPGGEYLCEKLQGGLAAIALPSESALTTAVSNDLDADLTYAQGVFGLGKSGDILLALSTSGNAKNVYYAAVTARALGLTVVAFTGESGGRLKDVCDVLLNVPQTETYRVQELHLPLYHLYCMCLENEFFGA